MRTILFISLLSICSFAAAQGTAHQLLGTIYITNTGARYAIQNMTIDANHRHPTLASCEAAKQQLIDEEMDITIDTLAPHYGLTTGKINKISHLSCIPINAAFE